MMSRERSRPEPRNREPQHEAARAKGPDSTRKRRQLMRAVKQRMRIRLRRGAIIVTDETAVKRAVKAAALGNAMEWFDFGLYSYMAVTIGKVFYSGAGGGVKTLLSLATFAISFLVRPLGGTFFGPLGDRIGRKRVLAMTMLLMAAGTFCVGVLPSYAAAGFWSPLLLVVCRLVQGFSTGGEYGGASTFIAEYAPDKKRGFYGSFLEFGTLCGYVGAAGIVAVFQSVLSEDALVGWGWRVPFLIGGPLGLVGLYLRMKLDETPAFQQMSDASAGDQRPSAEPGEASAPGTVPGTAGPEADPQVEQSSTHELGRIFQRQWRALLLCITLVGAYNVTDYMLLSYMPTYLTATLDYPAVHGTVILIGVMCTMLLLINSVGRLSDRAGRRPLLLTGMLGFLVLTVPSFLLLRQGSLAAVVCGMLLLGLSLVCLLGTMSATLPALFPTELRYGALSLGYNLATSIFGGTTPVVMDALVHSSGNGMMPAYYTVLFAVVGVVSVLLLRETARKPLLGSPPSVATLDEAREIAASPRGVPEES